MREGGKKIGKMERVLRLGLMELNTMETTKRAKSTAMVFSNGLMEAHTEDSS